MAKLIIQNSTEIIRPNISNLLKSVKENKGKSYRTGITQRDLNKWNDEK